MSSTCILRKHRFPAERDRRRRRRTADCRREGRIGKRPPRRQHRDRDGARWLDAHIAECAGSRHLRSVVGQGAARKESHVECARGERRGRKGTDRCFVYRGRRISRDGRRSAGEADGDVAHARHVAQRRSRPDSGSHIHRLGAAARRSDAGGGLDDALQHGHGPGGHSPARPASRCRVSSTSRFRSTRPTST